MVFARANATVPTSWGLYQEAYALTCGDARFGSNVSQEDAARALALLEQATTMPDCPAEAFDMLEGRLSHADRRDAERRVAVLRRSVEVTDDPILRLKLALALTRWIKLPEEALDVLTPLLTLSAPPVAARWLAFDIHRSTGRHAEALTLLDGIAVSDDDRAALDVTRGLVLDDLGRHDEALQLYMAAANGEGDPAVAAGLLCLRALLARGVPDADRYFVIAEDAMNTWFASADPVPVEAFYFSVPSWYPHTVETPRFTSVVLSTLHLMEEDIWYQLTCARLVYYVLRERYDRFSETQVALRPPLPLSEASVRAAIQCLPDSDRCHEVWADYLREVGDVPEMVRHRLRDLLADAVKYPGTIEHARYAVLGDDFLPDPESAPAATWSAVHAVLIELVKEFRPTGSLDEVFGPLYVKHWRRFLDRHRLEAEHDEAVDALTDLQWGPPVPSALFQCAYRAHVAGRLLHAAADYERLIALVEDPAALFNLSLIREREGAQEEALTFAQRASQADPTNTKYADRIRQFAMPAGRGSPGRGATTRGGRGGRAGRAAAREAAAASAGGSGAAPTVRPTDGDAFLRTAPERWPLLDRYKRQVLATLHVIDGFSGFAELATYSGVEERYLRGHWRKLVELGMIIDEGAKYEINPFIRPLIERERTHAVATRLIRADDSVALKPIFNSRREYEVYSILVGLFPNQLVFPNMGLQAVFQYDRMRELLDAETFGYYLRAQVDFCITSTVSYFPILCFEVDSLWHDGAQQQQRDQRKDHIFQRGDVPLLRVRPHGQPTRDALRMAIIEAVCSAREQMLAGDDRIASRYGEIDFAPFTMTALPFT